MPRPPVVRRPMMREEVELARALGRVSYQPATFDKRFGRELAARVERDAPEISGREAECLRRVAWRYRRQLTRPARELLARVLSQEPHAARRVPLLHARKCGKTLPLEEQLLHVEPPASWAWPTRRGTGAQLSLFG